MQKPQKKLPPKPVVATRTPKSPQKDETQKEVEQGLTVPTKQAQQERKWFSVNEAAAYLGCSPTFLNKDRVTNLHGIRFSKLGRHIRYAKEDLDAFLESHKA